GVERRLLDRSAPGPPADADAFVRVGFARDAVGEVRDPAGMERRRATREAGAGEIEGPPPEVHRTRLAEESPAEGPEHTLGARENAPAAPGRVGVVGGVYAIGGEGNGVVRDLDRPRPDPDRSVELAQQGAVAGVEVGNGLRLERQTGDRAVAGPRDQVMIDEVELDL